MIDALVVISLVLGGVAVDVASRTPTVMYFDLLFPALLGFRVLWGKWPSIPDTRLIIVVLICLASQALTALTNPGDIYKSILTVKCFVFGFLLYCMLHKTGIREWCIPIWLGAAGSITLLPFYSAVREGMTSISAIKDTIITPMGPNNYVACYLTMLLPVAAALFFRSRFGYKKLVYGACVVLGTAGLLVTLSRAAFVSLALAVLLSSSMMYKAGFRLKHSALALLTLIIAMVIFSQQLVAAYDFLILKVSIGDEDRIVLWQKAIETFKENPVLGVGPGQFVNYTHESGVDNSRLGAHSTYLQELAEGGILGALPIFALVYIALRRCYRAARFTYDSVQVSIWIGLLASMIHNAFDSLFWTQHFQALFWLLLLISASGFSNVEKHAEAAPSERWIGYTLSPVTRY